MYFIYIEKPKKHVPRFSFIVALVSEDTSFNLFFYQVNTYQICD